MIITSLLLVGAYGCAQINHRLDYRPGTELKRIAASSMTVDSMAHIHGKVYDAVVRRFPTLIHVHFSSYDPTKWTSKWFHSNEFSLDVPSGEWSVEIISYSCHTVAFVDSLYVERGEDIEILVTTGVSFVAAP